jgi:hypothetical protein
MRAGKRNRTGYLLRKVWLSRALDWNNAPDLDWLHDISGAVARNFRRKGP